LFFSPILLHNDHNRVLTRQLVIFYLNDMRLPLKATRSIAIGASLASFAVPGVLGWGAAGHEIVATIAQIYTEPAAMEKLCTILNAHTGANFNTESITSGGGRWSCNLASISTWADKYKYQMRWSAALHYVNGVGDHPADTCLFPGPEGWAGKSGINVLGGIHNTSNILLDWASGEIHDVELAQEALKFIVHFVGDLHMPLHLVGRDRGGNSVDVCWEGRRSNLHSVWDGLIVAKAIRQTGRNYSRPLPAGFERVEENLRGAIYDSYIRRIVWEGVEGKWAENLDDWIACPAGDGKPEMHKEATTVLSTLRDFFLPGWISERGIETPVTDTEFICPYHWAKPIHALNCELIWPKEIDEYNLSSRSRRARCKKFPHPPSVGLELEEELQEAGGVESEEVGEPPYELDNPDYTRPIEERMLLEQFLAQGGVRLAAILNYIFADGPSVGHVHV
jgi:hypothetical protein